MNILYFCLSYSGMKYDTFPFFGEKLPRKKLVLIWFPFLTSLAFIEVYVLAILTFVICFKARLHRRFLSQQLNASLCNFCRAEVATSCYFIAILVQFVSVKVNTNVFLKQKVCAC